MNDEARRIFCLQHAISVCRNTSTGAVDDIKVIMERTKEFYDFIAASLPTPEAPPAPATDAKPAVQ